MILHDIVITISLMTLKHIQDYAGREYSNTITRSYLSQSAVICRVNCNHSGLAVSMQDRSCSSPARIESESMCACVRTYERACVRV